ncbi:hypothetical protein [Geosporobacter ferrireducens]|uniref:hypothetical protein n=1 Tax=Geosporobacter ferrireducens TaxID=1424294 RepID=UPI00139B12F0|nr:hypothetical protein [Geosporobacter ferrireducens]MTI53762.1 hypothetical protein [Geosporobacter ferrireducens]
MKIVNKAVEMISKTNLDGQITPVKFRLIGEDESWIEIKVDQVLTKELNKLAGNKMWVYECQSLISGTLKRYQLRYEIDTCRWQLFKI